MNLTDAQKTRLVRFAFVLIFGAVLVSGCSSSSSGSDDSIPADSQSSNENEFASTEDGTDNGAPADAITEPTNDVAALSPVDSPSLTPDESSTESVTDVPDQSNINSTRVTFDITAPVYTSNALQVRVIWGDIDGSAAWVIDESWTVSEDLPIDTENLLTVTFSDQNGAITLGSFEQNFRTGSNTSESFQITEDQFDTNRWDSDDDGVSNLDELIAGTDPTVSGITDSLSQSVEPVLANLVLVRDKKFRITWRATASAQYYRVLENPDGISGFTDISAELDNTTTSFDHRVALYTRVNAQYLVQSCNDQGCADSEVMMVTGTMDDAIGDFKGNGGAFGEAVSLSADGKTLAVGAGDESSDATGINGEQNHNAALGSGAVYVFFRSSGLWQQQAYIKASNPRGGNGVPSDQLFGDSFGATVSLSADGNTLAVGANDEDSAATGINGDQDDDSANRSGAAYVFVRNDGLWQQQAYIKASNTGGGDHFGESVSLSADGNTLAVGARHESSSATGINGDQSNNAVFNSGAVYVFVRHDGLWQQQAYIKASNTSINQVFGVVVSLNSDGSTLAVGAHRESSAATGINGDQTNVMEGSASGAAYVFVRNDGLWQQQAYIKASNTWTDNQFGGALDLSADGNTLVIGSKDEDSGATGINGDQNDRSEDGSGAVYVFKRTDGIWEQQAYVKASNTSVDEQFGGDFGGAVSMSADGNTLVVGAKRTVVEGTAATVITSDQSDDPAPGAGAVYIY